MNKKLILLPSMMIGSLALVGSVAYMCFYNASPNYVARNNGNIDILYKEKLVHSFNEKSKLFEFNVDQYCLNSLFHNLMVQRNDQTYKDVQIKIRGNNYLFIVDCQYKLIKTKIYIKTTLNEQKDAYIFNIDYITTNIFDTYGLLMNNDELANIDLESLFIKSGLHINVDYKKHEFTYLKADLSNDLLSLMLANNKTDLLYSLLASNGYEIKMDRGLSFKSDFSHSLNNWTLSDSSLDGSHYVDYENRINLINNTRYNLSLLASKNVNDESIYDEANRSFNLLTTLAKKASNLDKLLSDRIKQKAPPQDVEPLDLEVARISESDINDIFKTSSILGYNEIYYQGSDVSFVVLDNLYCDIFQNDKNEQLLSFTFGFNFSNVETRAIIECECFPINNTFSLDFEISNVYYGTNIASSALKTTLIDLLDKALDEVAFFDLNKENHIINVNFDFIFDNDSSLAPYKTAFYDFEGIKSANIANTSLYDDGFINLKFTKNYI